jgi:hypothetical protein
MIYQSPTAIAPRPQLGDLQSSLQAINWRPILLAIGALVAGYLIYQAVTKRKGRRRSAFQELKRKQRAQQKALIYREEAQKAEREAA